MSPIPLGILAASGAGVAGSMELIQTVNVSVATNTITLSSIPNTYKDIKVILIGRSTNSSNSQTACIATINGVTSGNLYQVHQVFNNFGSVSSSYAANQNEINFQTIPQNSMAQNAFGVVTYDLLDYASTSKNKTFRMFSGSPISSVSNSEIRFVSAVFQSTSAVTSMTFRPGNGNWAVGSRVSIWGVKG